jgi:hypothetical protein
MMPCPASPPMIRAQPVGPPGHARIFPAEISWGEDCPLRPGDSAVVTITVTGDEAGACLGAGHRFTLWSGRVSVL